MTLKYPQQIMEGMTDYIIFSAHEYRTNQAIGGQATAGGGLGPAVGEQIILYMPSAPAVRSGQNWAGKRFDGPLGELVKEAASRAAGEINTANFSNFEEGIATGKRASDSVVDMFKSSMAKGGPAARQLGTNLVAGAANMTANQLTAMQRGEIYNPNIELLYDGPGLRGFNFNFNFVPKSAAEAQMVNQIILEFKKWSAPELNEETRMLKVPCVWSVSYMTGGGKNKNMNAFKRAAMTDITVQSNAGLNMHMSFPDGMPISTSLAMSFQEVDIITRNDHLNGSSNVGF